MKSAIHLRIKPEALSETAQAFRSWLNKAKQDYYVLDSKTTQDNYQPNMASNHTDIRKINLVRIAHTYYTYKDIGKAKAFLNDFGFQELATHGPNTYYRGTGKEPFVCCATAGSDDAFGGAAFVVESREDLEYASKTIPGATLVHEMQEEPGGGLRVTFKDPVDNFPFHLVYGQVPVEPSDEGLLQRKFNFVSHDTKPYTERNFSAWAKLC